MKRLYIIGFKPDLPLDEAKRLIETVDLCVMTPVPLPIGSVLSDTPYGTLKITELEENGRVLICRELDMS